RCRRSARACAGAIAPHTTVFAEAAQVRGNGQSLPSKADLVARTVPLLSPNLMIEPASRPPAPERKSGGKVPPPADNPMVRRDFTSGARTGHGTIIRSPRRRGREARQERSNRELSPS